MPFDLQIIIDSLATVFQFLKEQITQTGNLLQILVIVVIYIISLLFARQAKALAGKQSAENKRQPRTTAHYQFRPCVEWNGFSLLFKSA